MSRSRIVAIAVALVALTSCGQGNELSEAAEAELVGHVAEIRGAAEASDRERLEARLADLRLRVSEYRDSGEVGPSRAESILNAAADVESAARSIPPATTTTTTAAPPPEKPKDEDDEKNDDDDQDKKDDEKRGKDDD